MRAPPLAAAAAGRLADADAGARPGSGPGLGLCAGSGSGAGSLPGLVLFELGLTGMGYEHTRYPDPNRLANGPAPLSGSKPLCQRLSVNRRDDCDG